MRRTEQAGIVHTGECASGLLREHVATMARVEALALAVAGAVRRALPIALRVRAAEARRACDACAHGFAEAIRQSQCGGAGIATTILA
jgi:hypothetical protein